MSVAFALVLLVTLNSASSGQQSSAAATPSPTPQQLTALPESVLNAELRSARGRAFRLSDYAGKVLVINLWATWLIPSRMETPELVKLQAHFWSRAVRVVGLSTEDPDQSTKQVRQWVRSFRIQYKIGWAPEEVANTLMQGRDAIPQTYVVSRTGRIVKRFVGFNPSTTPAQFKAAIEEALREKALEQSQPDKKQVN